MTLLEDLQSLDLSGIVNARASISVSIGTDEFNAMVSSGASASALGDFGASLEQLRARLEEPETLLQPILDAIEPLLVKLDIDLGPFEDYKAAVEQGAGLMSTLLSTLDADPALLGQTFGVSLGSLFDTAAQVAENYLPIDLGDLDQLRAIIDRVDSGDVLDPALFAELALDVLAPFSRNDLVQIRSSLEQIFDISGSVQFDATLTAPLVLAFDRVASATTEAQLQAALTNLQRVRTQVLNSIRDQYQAIASLVGAIPLHDALRSLQSVSGSLRNTEQDILKFLDSWRRDIARARELIEQADIAPLIALIQQMIDQFEALARQQIKLIFDPAVEHLKELVRGLLGHLRLRALRNAIRSFIVGIADAIRELDLDAPAVAVRELLASIGSAIDSADFAERIQEALQNIENQINQALSGVISALETIGNEINAVAGQAQAVLEQAAAVLVEFKATADGIQVAIENLGIEQATQQVIDNLVKIRETVEELLSVAPLPEPLREQVTQLIDLVKDIDVEAVFEPLHSAVAQFDIPDSVSAEITVSLQSMQEVVQNLIPAELIASIEAEVNDVLDVIRGFDPAGLLDGVTAFINDIADQVDAVSVADAAQSISGPFQAILDKLDELHPDKLLAPIIDGYDALMGKIPTPSPATVLDRTVGTVGAAADKAAQAATAPARSLPPTTQSTAQTAIEVVEPTLPGDIVRLLGYVPNKLRETLAGLEAGPAGEAIAAIDGFTSGLARDLRRVRSEVVAIEAKLEDGIDQLLAPVAAAQSRAQLSMRVNFAAGGTDLTAAMTVTAGAGPGGLRTALADTMNASRAEAHNAAVALGGSVGLALEQAADLLEFSSLGRITRSLDAFLAALDPEPIAQELDALVVAMLAKIPQTLEQLGEAFSATMEKIASIAEELNPGIQAQRFLEVLNVIQQELDLLNPRHLAADLGEVHQAIRDSIAAYDPRGFAVEIDAVLDQLATSLRQLSPANLLGDISFLQDTVNLVQNAVPTQALTGIGESLTVVGETLGELDIGALLDSIANLGPTTVEAFEALALAIKNEVLALLESLKFASGSVSVSMQAEVNV